MMLENLRKTYYPSSPTPGTPSPEPLPSSTESSWGLGLTEKVAVVTEQFQKDLLASIREGRKFGRQDQGSGNPVLGCLLKKVRQSHGDSQAALAARAGVHATTINKIESGQRGMSLATFLRIDDVYHGELREALIPLYTGSRPPERDTETVKCYAE